ncbi:UDP-N-acetyl-D-glucosamine 6-dehydrogenase [Corynebacterium atrinae]|uniref:nucleotide sugar dehydrogenase n=1 Tax=Corynebacterium atrinae TaxID=1336740 RepID=UPI0025B3620A|nr:nucleotide sugar dehydrogenase [Corynebacterium atrinae]WJY64517.1 UDP-N-acetyl-D-glucosamine 6-dehydrogenase [Corynebacterium atrinae]
MNLSGHKPEQSVPGERHLVVIGQGYVGLPLAMRASEVGFRVTGLDRSGPVVDRLNEGRSHVDDITDQQVSQALAAGFSATTDSEVISRADIVVICVPTPLDPRGGPDLRAVRSAVKDIATYVRSGTLIVLESTVYPGTTEDILVPAIQDLGFNIGTDIFIAFSPERIDPGNPKYGLKNTPKVVGAVTPTCQSHAVEFYSQIVDTVVQARGTKEAELAKLLENTFRHVNIALVNEMVRICHELDIDLWDSIDCAESKPFGFMAFRPGPGVGGHCIPVDPKYLSHRVKSELGYPFRLLEMAEVINDAAPSYVAERVWSLLNEQRIPVNGAKVLLLGVTYKPDVSDCRESPADPLYFKLSSWGANISYHDPFVDSWQPESHGLLTKEPLARVEDLSSAVESADIVVFLQAHKEYDLEQLSAQSTVILDTRGKLNVNSKAVQRL